MYEVTTSIDLKVPASRVWDVITSFAEFDVWNPAMVRMHAVLTKGAPISFVARAMGRTEQIEGELVSIEIGQELGWRRPVSLPSAWWLRSERYLRITRLGVGESRFVQTERFAGLTLPFIWRDLRPKVEEVFNEMNRALKSRAESRRNGRFCRTVIVDTITPCLLKGGPMRFVRILGRFRSGWMSLTLVSVATLVASCGGRHTEAEKPATPAIVAPPPEFEMNKIPEASSAAPAAHDARAPKESPPSPPPKKAKTMQPVFNSEKGVATIVGTVGAVFKVAGATLRIPEDALQDGKDVHFGVSKTTAAKGEPARLGAAYDVGPTLTSAGAPFELTLPFPEDAGELVLVAIRRSHGKDGKVKSDIATVAPKSVDTSKHEARFEVSELPEGEVFVAKKPASTEPAATTSAAPPAASGTAPPRH